MRRGSQIVALLLLAAGLLATSAQAAGAASGAGAAGSSPRPSDTGTTSGVSTPGTDPQVVLSGRVEVPRGTQSADIIVFSGSIRIDGEVNGDIVSLNGPITIAGLVNGDVVSLDGAVLVTRDGHVTGNIVARRTPVVQSGGEVQGDVQGVGPYLAAVPFAGRLLWWLPMTVSTLILGLVMLGLFPRGMQASSNALRSRPLASAAWGLAAGLVVPAAGVLALVSLIALPLGLGVMLSLGLFLVAGYTLGAWQLGRLVLKDRTVIAFLAGWGVLRAAALIPFAGGTAAILATLAGIGGTCVAIWRARRGGLPEIPAAQTPSGSGRGAHRRGTGSAGYDPGEHQASPPGNI